jgi:Protein of unknown function (DUF3311)
MQTRSLAFTAIAVLYLLHQDVWLWRAAQPLVFGFLPAGLAYHAAYCFAAAALMWGLTKVAWPDHLETAAATGARVGAPDNKRPGGMNEKRSIDR